MIFIRHEDLDDYLDSIGSDEPTGNFVATEAGVFIDDVPGPSSSTTDDK